MNYCKCLLNHLMPITSDVLVDKPYVAICFNAMKEICLSLEMICNLKKDGNEIEGDMSHVDYHIHDSLHDSDLNYR